MRPIASDMCSADMAAVARGAGIATKCLLSAEHTLFHITKYFGLFRIASAPNVYGSRDRITC